jgi:hypothetical protein
MASKPKIGRPKKPSRELREQFLKIRMSREEMDALKKAAPSGLTTWARSVLLRAAGRL